jgi:transposase
MALTIVDTCTVIGGVDTHADAHVAAALNHIGGLLGVESFPTTLAGYGRLLAWLRSFGTVSLVGVEGTGSYGAGLTRHLTAAGVRVVEVDRSDRQERHRSRQVRPSRRGERSSCRAVGQGEGSATWPGWHGGSDQNVDGGQTLRSG